MYQGKNAKTKLVFIDNRLKIVSNEQIQEEINKFIENSQYNVIDYNIMRSTKDRTHVHILFIYETI